MNREKARRVTAAPSGICSFLTALPVFFRQGEYEGLAKKLSEYVVKLIDHVRGNDELDIILNEGVDGHGIDNHGKLTRLKLALKFNEKQVRLCV